MGVKFYERLIRKANSKSDRAIEKFKTTETQLQEQVGVIDATVSLIDEEMAKLRDIKTAAIQRRKENVGIIGRIREFISGGE